MYKGVKFITELVAAYPKFNQHTYRSLGYCIPNIIDLRQTVPKDMVSKKNNTIRLAEPNQSDPSTLWLFLNTDLTNLGGTSRDMDSHFQEQLFDHNHAYCTIYWMHV